MTSKAKPKLKPFKAIPRIVLEGGHWCDKCEHKNCNYGHLVEVDPFFAQMAEEFYLVVWIMHSI